MQTNDKIPEAKLPPESAAWVRYVQKALLDIARTTKRTQMEQTNNHSQLIRSTDHIQTVQLSADTAAAAADGAQLAADVAFEQATAANDAALNAQGTADNAAATASEAGSFAQAALTAAEANALANANTASNLEEMQTFYSFGPDGAEISSPGSAHALALRNDSIAMLESGQVVSYWNAGTMYVTSLVGESVVLGNHQIVKYGTGTVVRAL